MDFEKLKSLVDSKFEFIKLLIGKDTVWKEAWELETEEGIEKIKRKCSEDGIYFSGIKGERIARYRDRRSSEFRDEERRRLIEGLKVIPPWLSLFLSILALIISLKKR